MRRITLGLLASLAVAASAAADDPVRVVADGKPAAAWRICIEEKQEQPGPPPSPACIDSTQTITDFVWPEYDYRLLIYIQAQPEKITLETAVHALRVAAGVK